MVTTALVTGSAGPAEQVAAALRDAGVEVVAVTDLETDLERVADAVSSFAPGSLDCYIQLPVMLHPTGETVVARVRTFLETGLLTRFRLAEQVLPVLSDEGRVLLVRGHTPGDTSTPDDHAARHAFLDVLAHAIRADKAPATPRVRIVGDERSAADIARLALRPETSSRRPVRAYDLAAREEEKSYQDWRTEVMGMVNVEF
jgi:hypothetical protein